MRGEVGEACGKGDYDCDGEEMVEGAYGDVDCGDGDGGGVCWQCGDAVSDNYKFYYGGDYDEEKYG